jgi:hypothetical protein
VPLEGLSAREPTPVWGLRPARAWAPSGEREVACAVFHALGRPTTSYSTLTKADVHLPLAGIVSGIGS